MLTTNPRPAAAGQLHDIAMSEREASDTEEM